MMPPDDRHALALAVHQGDQATAIAIIDTLACRSARWADAAQWARARLSEAAPLPDANPMPLPMPGHRVGSTLGDPKMSKKPA